MLKMLNKYRYFDDFSDAGEPCPDTGGTFAGKVCPLTFKMLSKNPSRQSLVRELKVCLRSSAEFLPGTSDCSC